MTAVVLSQALCRGGAAAAAVPYGAIQSTQGPSLAMAQAAAASATLPFMQSPRSQRDSHTAANMWPACGDSVVTQFGCAVCAPTPPAAFLATKHASALSSGWRCTEACTNATHKVSDGQWDSSAHTRSQRAGPATATTPDLCCRYLLNPSGVLGCPRRCLDTVRGTLCWLWARRAP